MAESEREKSKLKSPFFFFKPFIELEILEGKTFQKVKAAQEFGHVTLLKMGLNTNDSGPISADIESELDSS